MMMLSNSLHNGPTRLELSIRQHSYRRWADGIGRLCTSAAKSAKVPGPAGRVTVELPRNRRPLGRRLDRHRYGGGGHCLEGDALRRRERLHEGQHLADCENVSERLKVHAGVPAIGDAAQQKARSPSRNEANGCWGLASYLAEEDP